MYEWEGINFYPFMIAVLRALMHMASSSAARDY
jgi:hypothetical protein